MEINQRQKNGTPVIRPAFHPNTQNISIMTNPTHTTEWFQAQTTCIELAAKYTMRHHVHIENDTWATFDRTEKKWHASGALFAAIQRLKLDIQFAQKTLPMFDEYRRNKHAIVFAKQIEDMREECEEKLRNMNQTLMTLATVREFIENGKLNHIKIKL